MEAVVFHIGGGAVQLRKLVILLWATFVQNEKKRQDSQNSSLENCLIQYELVFGCWTKKGNFVEMKDLLRG